MTRYAESRVNADPCFCLRKPSFFPLNAESALQENPHKTYTSCVKAVTPLTLTPQKFRKNLRRKMRTGPRNSVYALSSLLLEEISHKDTKLRSRPHAEGMQSKERSGASRLEVRPFVSSYLCVRPLLPPSKRNSAGVRAARAGPRSRR